jgi:hypothetical protein
MSLVVGTRRSFRGKDAGSLRIDFRYGGDRGHGLGAIQRASDGTADVSPGPPGRL